MVEPLQKKPLTESGRLICNKDTTELRLEYRLAK